MKEETEDTIIKIILIPTIILGYPIAWAFYKLFLEEKEDEERSTDDKRTA